MTLYGGDGSVSPPPKHQQDDGVRTDRRTEKLLQGFANLYRAGQLLTDIKIESQDGHIFHAHKALLAAASDYFLAMFTGDMEEKHRDHIVLKGVTGLGMRSLLQFVYTGELGLSEDNILQVIAAAAHLQLGFVLPECMAFMAKMLDVENCVDVYNTAKTYQLKAYENTIGASIEDLSFDFICNHFYGVIKGGHHLRLSAEDLIHCLNGRSEDGTNLIRFGPERELFEAIMKWRETNKDDRPVGVIRYPLMTFAELDEASDILQNEGLTDMLQLVDQARHYHSSAMHRQVYFAQRELYQVRNKPCVVTLAKSTRPSRLGADVKFFILSSMEGCPPPAQKLETLKWLEIPKLDNNIHENIRRGFIPHAWEAVNGFLVVYGSTSFGQLRCYMLDLRTFLWSPMATMNVPRTNSPLVECDGDLFSLGGIIKGGHQNRYYPNGGASDLIERYSFASGRWEIVGQMGESLYNHGACSLDGKIYMYGGRRQDGAMSRSMYTYEPSTNQWREHHYRFPINENPVLCVLLDRIYAADPAIRQMSYYSCSDQRNNTWWGVLMRERHLVPVDSLHAVFLNDSVFFLNGVLQPESNIVPQNGSSNKCTQVTVHKSRGISGHPIRQPDYPEGWTPCVGAALSLPWNIVREARPVA